MDARGVRAARARPRARWPRPARVPRRRAVRLGWRIGQDIHARLTGVFFEPSGPPCRFGTRSACIPGWNDLQVQTAPNRPKVLTRRLERSAAARTPWNYEICREWLLTCPLWLAVHRAQARSSRSWSCPIPPSSTMPMGHARSRRHGVVLTDGAKCCSTRAAWQAMPWTRRPSWPEAWHLYMNLSIPDAPHTPAQINNPSRRKYLLCKIR